MDDPFAVRISNGLTNLLKDWKQRYGMQGISIRSCQYVTAFHREPVSLQ